MDTEKPSYLNSMNISMTRQESGISRVWGCDCIVTSEEGSRLWLVAAERRVIKEGCSEQQYGFIAPAFPCCFVRFEVKVK
jgi:hypothetical protein